MDTQVDQSLLLEFFLTFARCECALKSTGFYRHHPEDPLNYPSAEPDWDTFAVSLRDTFKPDATTELREACEYMLESPPNRQIICGGQVTWETPVRPPSESNDIDFLIRMIRCVRNNLFHGGKHNIEVHENTQRTETLLRSSLTILTGCLDVSPNQKAAYDEAYI